MTLEQYLNNESMEFKIDFSIRVYAWNDGKPHFYIHPTGKDGKTLDFEVNGNQLIPIYKTEETE
jgi:hypothetical protein